MVASRFLDRCGRLRICCRGWAFGASTETLPFNQGCPVKCTGDWRNPLSGAGFQGFLVGVDLNVKPLVCDVPEISVISGEAMYEGTTLFAQQARRIWLRNSESTSATCS